MSVIVICEGLDAGGAVANVAWQQTLGLSRLQSVCLISDGLSAERRQQLASSPGPWRLSILRLPAFRTLHRFAHLPHQLLWILLALRATQRQLQAPDTTVICHSHPLAAAVAWRFGPRVRVVMVSHGDIFHRPPGTYDPAITWLYRRTTAYAHRRAAWSVALSPVMAERIQAYGVPPERIALIPNGLDPGEIGLSAPPHTPPDHWQQQPLQLLFVGRLDPIKGLLVLLEGLALALKAGLAVKLDVVGEGSPNVEDQLQQLSQQLGLSQVVHWLGPQRRASLARDYRHCHVVVVPSLDDPLPTVVLEAMACGRPVLGSAVGGIGFMVLDRRTGVLVPPAQPQALADALVRLDQDRPGLAAMGQAALQRSQEFSWSANVQALQALIAASGS